MKRFLKHQKRILRKSVLVAIIYITTLLYFLYSVYHFTLHGTAAMQFAEEELIILAAGLIAGPAIHYIVKRKSYRRRSFKLSA